MRQERFQIKALKKCLREIFTENEHVNIEQENIDDFIVILADYFLSCVTIDVDKRQRNFNFKNQDTKAYFELGMNCIESGTNNIVLEMILSFVADSIIRQKSLTFQELFEIKVLEKLILIMQQFDVKQFLLITNQLCSTETSSGIEQKFGQANFFL
jgi:hypothetical protein